MIEVFYENKKIKVKDCRGVSSLTGLMFDKMKNHDGALIRGNSIWMPFVSKKLRLAFLDSKYKITRVMNSVPLSFNPKTWKIYWDSNASYCLESKKNINFKVGKKIRVRGLVV